jgi:hypothetical protein
MNNKQYFIAYLDKPFNDVKNMFYPTRAIIEVRFKITLIITISHYDESLTNIEIIAKEEKNVIQAYIHIVNMYPELFPNPLSRNISKACELQRYKDSHKLHYIYFK